MLIIKSLLFSKHPEIIFGFSTKIGADRNSPFFFNLSHSVDDDMKTVEENRNIFFNSLALGNNKVALQKQVHGDKVVYVDHGGNFGESDAMITDKINLGLAISSADCAAIFIYDKKHKVIAAVHSGWRGTQQKILIKTLNKLKGDFNSNPEDLIAYIGPSISQKNYEVDKDVASRFEEKYYYPSGNKFMLDVAQVNYDILLEFGLRKVSIQKSSLCSFGMKNLLHSYRRDGKNSGRALGVIAITG